MTSKGNIKLSELKALLIITKIKLLLSRPHKREEIISYFEKEIDDVLCGLTQENLKTQLESIEYFHRLYKDDEEVESLFDEFGEYKFFKFGNNLLFVDGTRFEEFRSFDRFNYSLKKYCIFKDYLEFEQEKIVENFKFKLTKYATFSKRFRIIKKIKICRKTAD